MYWRSIPTKSIMEAKTTFKNSVKISFWNEENFKMKVYIWWEEQLKYQGPSLYDIQIPFSEKCSKIGPSTWDKVKLKLNSKRGI